MSQGFDLHRHIDVEMIRCLFEPGLGHKVSLEIKMVISPEWCWINVELMLDDTLCSIVARMKPQSLRVHQNRLRITIMCAMSYSKAHVSRPSGVAVSVFSRPACSILPP